MEEIYNITTTSTDDPLQLSLRGLKTTSSNRIEENKPSKTKKKKSTISNIDKAKMWKMLEDDKPIEQIHSVETGH